MRTALLLAALVALAPLLAPAADASAPYCTGIRDRACGGTVCVYDKLAGEWRCYLPIDWYCLVWRPCWYPAGLP